MGEYLVTTLSSKKKLYHDILSKDGLEIVTPPAPTQSLIMEAIYLIKAGVDLAYDEDFIDNKNWPYLIKSARTQLFKSHPNKRILLERKIPNPKAIIEEAIKKLRMNGCHHIILGCTELPLVLPYLRKDLDVYLIDPNSITADSIVETLQNIEKEGLLTYRRQNFVHTEKGFDIGAVNKAS